MDIDQTKIYAGEQIVRALCSGKDFRGLGPEAEHLIRATAQGADENAKHISTETTRTQDAFFEMLDRVRDQFVMDVLGFGDEKMTPQEAAYKLVDTVWTQYIDWAQAGRQALLARIGGEIGADPSTKEGMRAIAVHLTKSLIS